MWTVSKSGSRRPALLVAPRLVRPEWAEQQPLMIAHAARATRQMPWARRLVLVLVLVLLLLLLLSLFRPWRRPFVAVTVTRTCSGSGSGSGNSGGPAATGLVWCTWPPVVLPLPRRRVEAQRTWLLPRAPVAVLVR